MWVDSISFLSTNLRKITILNGCIPLQCEIAVAIVIVFDLQNNKKIPLGKCNGYKHAASDSNLTFI